MDTARSDPQPIRLDSATITAENVVIGPAPQADNGVESRYRINAVLFAVLMILLTVWFKAHLETYLTQLAIIGTVTGIAVVQMIASWFPTAVDNREDLRKRWLARRDTRAQLGVAVILAILLLFGTKSVYVKMGKTAESKVLIDLRDPADKTIEKMILDGDHSTAGRPFFMFGRPAWKLVVTKPRGYEAHSVSFGLTGSDSVTFPFDQKEIHVVRILAQIKDQQFFPPCGSGVAAKGSITFDSKTTYQFDFCQYSMILVGAPASDIAKIVLRHQSEFETEYLDRVIEAQLTGDVPRMTLGLVRQQAKSPPIPEELKQNRNVSITITYGGFVRKSTHTVTDSEIQSVYVGESP